MAAYSLPLITDCCILALIYQNYLLNANSLSINRSVYLPFILSNPATLANILVSVRTRRNCSIHWFPREKLAMPRGMDSERTSELTSLAKLLLNQLVPEREVSYA